MRIGIIGGSFDPIHLGHMRMADDATRELCLDEVWFVPCTISRYDKNLSSYEDRVWMLHTAINEFDNPRLRVSLAEQEFRTQGKMYPLALALEDKYPEHDFVYLIGDDTEPLLKTWYRGDELVERFAFTVIPRCGISSTKVRAHAKDISIYPIPNVAEGVHKIIRRRSLYV
jgi:nicotinate-nucleotide adenylyltransferase